MNKYIFKNIVTKFEKYFFNKKIDLLLRKHYKFVLIKIKKKQTKTKIPNNLVIIPKAGFIFVPLPNQF